jgi:nicotinamide-nucleotide amidase
MIKTAVILSTGDELTTGRVVDTNSATIADRLSTLGVELAAVLKVGDDRNKLVWALRQGVDLGDLIIGTGGLGPTVDDLTVEAVAEFLSCPLKLLGEVAESLKRRFESRGLPWTNNNLKQALFPEHAVIIPNPIGTAPGFRVAIGPGKDLIWLSGVPQEMTAMLHETVIPWIERERHGGAETSTCTFKIHGLTESKVDDILQPVTFGPEAKLSFRAHYPDLSLRLTVRGDEEREAVFDRLRNQIRTVLGGYVYSEEDITLEEAVGRLLSKTHQTLSLAESCTGGLISHRITRVAGSSAYFMGAAITYSNQAKLQFLGVKPVTLEQYAAVSREAAIEMSEGIRKQTGTTVGLSVTGIAGPTGGSANKPVGTVWISIAQEAGTEAKLLRFNGDRQHVILGASQAALSWLHTTLLQKVPSTDP